MSDNQEMINVMKVDAELNELLMKPEAVLIEVVNTSKSGLILNTDSTSSLSGTAMVQWSIAKVGESVLDYQENDLVYDLASMNSVSYLSLGEKNYILTDKYNIKLGVRKKVSYEQ